MQGTLLQSSPVCAVRAKTRLFAGCRIAWAGYHPAQPVNRRACSRNRVVRRKAADELAQAATGDTPLVAVEGDLVTIHFDCYDDSGEILESSREAGEPTSFQIGAGDIVGNNLYQAFDEAVRGLGVGDRVRIKAEGGEWKQDLLFVVPRTHEEVVRLENRYKNVGGLSANQVVQLSNGGMALVVEIDEERVVLDANSALAGKNLTFELEMVGIERGS